MSDGFPELRTKRLLLRRFVDTDLDSVFRGLSDPQVIQYYGISFKTREETKEQLNWFAELEKSGSGIWWAICSAGDTEFFGAGGFNNWQKQHKKAEIGFWLLPEYWGKGFMQEAMPVLLNYGFTEMELHRVEGFVESENINCIKAIKKLGFEFEGRMRECEIKDGKFIDLDIFVKLKRE